MSKNNTSWVAPILMVVAIFAIFLSLTYLPMNQWGISIDSGSIWLYAPWLIAFAVGLYVLRLIYKGR